MISDSQLKLVKSQSHLASFNVAIMTPPCQFMTLLAKYFLTNLQRYLALTPSPSPNFGRGENMTV